MLGKYLNFWHIQKLPDGCPNWADKKLPHGCPNAEGGGGVKTTFGQCPKERRFFMMASLRQICTYTNYLCYWPV